MKNLIIRWLERRRRRRALEVLTRAKCMLWNRAKQDFDKSTVDALNIVQDALMKVWAE